MGSLRDMGDPLGDMDVVIWPRRWLKARDLRLDREHEKIAKAGSRSIARWLTKHPGEFLRLSGADLSGVDLSEANLERALLRRARLEEACLYRANLTGASLLDVWASDSNLTEANLKEADLSEGRFGEAWLDQANLEGANLHRAFFYRANLTGANLKGALLHAATLERAKVQKTNLQDANLSGAILTDANLSDADISAANVYGTTLGAAITRGLRKANVYWGKKDQEPPRWWYDAIHIDHRIFVSYSWSQADNVHSIADRLATEVGFDVWIDKKGLEPSSKFWKDIEGAIQRSTVFVQFWSKEARESDNVGRELELAVKNGIELLPIRMDRTKLSLGLEQSIIYLDFGDPEFYKKLVAGIRRAGRQIESVAKRESLNIIG